MFFRLIVSLDDSFFPFYSEWNKKSCNFAPIRIRDVAQLASAPRSGRGGRRFESFHPDIETE